MARKRGKLVDTKAWERLYRWDRERIMLVSNWGKEWGSSGLLVYAKHVRLVGQALMLVAPVR